MTAQAEAEQISEVAQNCKKLGLKHFWIDLRGANQSILGDKKVQAYLGSRIKELLTLLEGNEKAMLHCAAGIHRTGTIGYTLLRCSGYEPAQAFDMLKVMRVDTHKGVGDWRIELAEKYLWPGVMKMRVESLEVEAIPEEKEVAAEDCTEYGEEESKE